MALINIVDPQKADGEVKEVFDILQKNLGVVPSPMQLASASPGVMNLQWQAMKYFSTHPNLSFGLLSSIRYLVAKEYNYAFCTNFNREILKKQGLSEEDVQKIEEDPFQAPLEDKERAMLAFVLNAIKAPEDVSQEEVDKLRSMGWQDSDIMDALVHGVNMIGSSILMKTFKMDTVC